MKVSFDDIVGLDKKHPAWYASWNSDPQSEPENVKLVEASTILKHIMDGDDLDVDVKQHPHRPFLMWVRKKS